MFLNFSIFLIFVIINKKQGSDDFMIDYEAYSKFYNPNKERIYGGIKEQKKEIEQELKEMKKSDLKSRKKSDPKSQFVRQEALNDGSLEKRIIKSLNAFTPEELTNKLNAAITVAGSTETINEIKNFKKDFDNGKLPYTGEELKEKIKEKKTQYLKRKITISDEQAKKLVNEEAEQYKNFFSNYEILDIHKESEKGFTAFLTGNKKTGKVEIFVGGNDDSQATPEDVIRTRAELQNSNRAEKEIVPSQEVAVEYLKIKGSLLTTLHQKLGTSEGKGEIKTSLLPTLAVSKADTFNIPYPKDRKGIDMTNHLPDVQKTGKELEGMQKYTKIIEP